MLVTSRKVSLQALLPYGCQVAVDQEFGASSALERTYERAGVTVDMFVEEANDASSAYGLFTFYQDPAMQPVPGVELARMGQQVVLMVRSRYFIRVIRRPDLSANELRSFLIAVGGPHLSSVDREKLPAPLRAPGMVAGSEKYLLGPEATKSVLPSFPVQIIGYADGVEAQLETYRRDTELMKLLVLSYPTPQLAELRYRTIQSTLSVGHRLGVESAYGRQQGSYVILVLDAASKAAADGLLNQFKVKEWVSSMPAYHPANTMVRDMMVLIVGNLELVLLIAVLGLMGGIALFACKRLILKAFPDSWFSREQDERLIRLRLR